MSSQGRAAQVLMNSYGEPQAELVRGEGCHVWDSSGKRYLDFLAGIAVNALGHAHPAFVTAISEQAATLAHISNFFVSPPQLKLAETLLDISGARSSGRVFFTNSGAEANEASLKLARLHGTPLGKHTVIALEGSFHGRTLGALSLTSNPRYREPFEPLPAGVARIEPTIEALEAALDEDVAALFLEPIQGEAGVVPLSHEFLRRARELTSQVGALLVVDEVQTGIARTGSWFGFQDSGITPDIITVAKGLGGGFPIGACIAYGEAAALFYPGAHGTTFGGNPLGCHVSQAVLDTIVELDLASNALLRGEQIAAAVLALDEPLVKGVRGRGLLLGIELAKDVAPEVAAAARAAGLIVNSPNPRVIRLAPPLTVGDEEVTEFLTLFRKALRDV
ncbi:acetylornithine transaminase [Actinomyces minihominis]|uniref:acetylornithine transaminase n=1 Tax=Actinomyces minihominis TaxID=2002838 RepID=UPI001F5DF01D|nr:acetylornithine transaminase [Actinomyces minihominis]